MSLEFKTINTEKDLEGLEEGTPILIEKEVDSRERKIKGVCLGVKECSEFELLIPLHIGVSTELNYTQFRFYFKEGNLYAERSELNKELIEKYRPIFGEVTKPVWKDEAIWKH